MNYTVYKSFLQVNTTLIAIQCEQPFTYIERVFEGDKTALSDDQKINLVLEKLATEIDPSGAIVDLQALINEAKASLDEAKKTQATIQGALLEMNETVLANTADIELLKEQQGGAEHA